MLRRCIQTGSKPSMEPSLEAPPFEKPSVAKAVVNFVVYKFGNLGQKECSTMHDMAKMFIHCLNHWKLETPALYKAHAPNEDAAAYKLNYARCIDICLLAFSLLYTSVYR